MLKGYLIEKYNHMTGAYTCNRLVEEARKLDMDLQIIGVHDCLVSREGIYNEGRLLEKRDFVINRYKWGACKDEINRLAEWCYNPLQAYNIYINKYQQVRNLHSEAFQIPDYLLGTSLCSWQALTDRLGCPVVAKGLESSMGEQICLLEKAEDLAELRQTYGKEKEWLFEEFIHTSFGRDMRFYSIRGQVVACMERRSQGDFRANVALGASVRPLEITPEIRQIAADIYRQTRLDFLGIDLMYGEEKPYFCEINVMPGLEGIERASGVNVARMILHTIQKDFEEDGCE